MALMDGMMRFGRLDAFITEVIDLYNEEYREKVLWEVWLHRVFDKSFAEFMESVEVNQKAAPTQEEVSNIVMESEAVLQGFAPAGVNANGTVPSAGDDSH